MKTLFHYVGNSRNYGDMAIKASMNYYLNLLAEEPINIIDINLKQAKAINKEHIEYMNDIGAGFIVGGGGLFMRGDGFDTKSGWQLNIEKRDLRRLRIPLCLFAIGYNVFPYDTHGLPKKALEHINYTLCKASVTSVRDTGTLNMLKQLRLQTDGITVCPDPALFATPQPITIPGTKPDEFLIGLNWAGDRINDRFLEGDEATVIYRLCEALKRLCQKYKARVVNLPHVHIYDGRRSWVFKRELGELFIDLVERVPWLYPEQQHNTPFFIGAYKRMNFILGMRGHSNILSFALGKPYIGIGDHKKNQFFNTDAKGVVVGNSVRDLYNNSVRVIENPPNNSEVFENMKLSYAYHIAATLRSAGVLCKTTSPDTK